MNYNRDGDIGTIRKLFYNFYLSSKKEYESSEKVKAKYVKLLTDNFIEFSYDKIFANFNK